MHSMNSDEINGLWRLLPNSKKVSAYSKALVKLEKIRYIENTWMKDSSKKPNLKEYVDLMLKYIPAATYVINFYYPTIEADKTRSMSYAVMELASNSMSKQFKKHIKVTYRWGKHSIYDYYLYAKSICENIPLLQSFVEFCY